MFRRNLIPVWVGIMLLSGMFLMGQETWPPPACVDNDGDGYGSPASAGCAHPELDCDDTNPAINPGASERLNDGSTCSDGIDNDCNSFTDGNDSKCDPNDLDMSALDFECVLNWPQPNVYRLTNLRGHLTEALAVAQSPTGGTFPLGTVIQVIPGEAMVKRASDWSPETNDWEFFSLNVSAAGTGIVRRGPFATNGLGMTCFSCHSKADAQWDLVCRKTHGCDPLGISDATLESLQQADPRCP